MKEIYAPKKVPRVSVKEKLHGHATIDLFNTQTKEYKRVEHDNFFTDGIENYFRSLGTFSNNPYQNSTVNAREIWKTVLGGLFLFDTALPETAMYMPAGTTMVGNGYWGGSNSGSPTELGSFNSTESSYDEDSVTMVYDFLTSQANGTIASLSLTTLAGGILGYGNASGTYFSGTIFDYLQEHTAEEYTTNTSDISAMLMSNGIITFGAQRLSSGISSFSAYRTVAPQIDSVDIFSPALTSKSMTGITITLPSTTSATYYFVNTGMDNVVAFVPSTVSSGSTVTFYLMDFSSGETSVTATEYSFTNGTGATISARSFFVLDETYAAVGYLGSTLYIYNYQTGALIGSSGTTSSSSAALNCGIQKIAPGLFIFPRTRYVYDVESKTSRPINLSSLYPISSTGEYGMSYNEELDVMWGAYLKSGNYGKITAFKNPLALMTINNLDSSVTKTAAQTMKVTYTVTRSS